MTQIRPPEEVLFAFSQWLQQWAEYAQLQAALFSASANPDGPAGDVHATDQPATHQEQQPPAHWLELAESGPPAHWLALFDEYGLEPPKIGAPPEDVQAGDQTPVPAPRPLQEWLGEFQRGLAQFTPRLVEPEDHAPVPDPIQQGDDPATDRTSPSHSEAGTLPERNESQSRSHQVEDHADPADALDSVDRVLPPGPYPVQRTKIPLAPAYARMEGAGEPIPATIAEGTAGTAETHATLQVTSPMQGTASRLPPGPGEGKGAETGSEKGPDPSHVPVRLRLNPKPPVAMPVPTQSPLPRAEESAGRALMQPSHPVPRLFIGVPASVAKPLSADPVPLVEPAGEFRQGEPKPPSTHVVDAEKAQWREKSTDADLVQEADLDSISSLLKRMDESLKPGASPKNQKEQSRPEWSQPARAHWPELPERLAPVQPHNILADPAHRMRVTREQRGRSWNA